MLALSNAVERFGAGALDARTCEHGADPGDQHVGSTLTIELPAFA
ncbi:MAG: hypothetical protein SFX73_02370 [Kofleriaceae bacterium]|nr:hypothetical protein [Kofleriaceae bacterium]